jgi:dTDP-glucose 4,6-dehydratase
MIRRAVVAGGAGFLGSHLCERLLASGFEVVSLDNYCTGSPANIAHLSSFEGFSARLHDVTEPLPVESPVHVVFNMASPASPIDYARLPIETLLAGALGTRNCLELAKKHRARFILASTSEVYGDPLVHPQPETYWAMSTLSVHAASTTRPSAMRRR